MGDCLRLCSGLRFLGFAMIFLVAAIVSLSYYAVVVVSWGPRLFHGGLVSVLAFAVVFVFHFLLVLLLWSYFMVVFHDPGAVPVGWQPHSKGNYIGLDSSVILADHTAARESEFLSTEGSGRRPNIRYCSHCQNNKPPRCHHCSVLLNVAFALSLLCFVVMHTSLVLSNTTTLEVYEKKNVVEWKYDLGKRKNFEQVFGSNKLFWFFPLFSKNDLRNIPALQGLDFPTRSDIEV